MSIVRRSALMILTLAAWSFAQDLRTATVVGTVTDSTGAAVPGAQVNVVNVQTKVETHGQTTAQGEYYVPFLNLGQYDVSVEAQGFKRVLRSGVVLEAGSTVRIDIQLEVGGVNQEIEVFGPPESPPRSAMPPVEPTIWS